jgi:hypothetical protein
MDGLVAMMLGTRREQPRGLFRAVEVRKEFWPANASVFRLLAKRARTDSCNMARPRVFFRMHSANRHFKL